jgi:hypothetical protein
MHDDYILNAGMKNVSKLASRRAVVITILNILS